jgi:hypothetical protein
MRLKIVREFQVTTEKSKGQGVDLKVGFKGTRAGLPLKVGPKHKFTSKQSQNISFEGSTDYVFTYRLIKIRSQGMEESRTRITIKQRS